MKSLFSRPAKLSIDAKPSSSPQSAAPLGLQRLSSHQVGTGLLSLVMWLACGGFALLMTVKCVPAWTEYLAVKRIVNELNTSSETEVRSIRDSFSKRASIENVTTISPQDLTITRDGSAWKVSFDYERRIPIAGNAVLVFEFAN